MAVSRRNFLRVVGGTTVIAAAGIGGFAATRTPNAALKPWETAGAGYADPRMRALSWAILAPNPHNRQPWLVDLREPDVVTLYCDRTRLLPETDPFDRQILIGLGCFLELARIAALQDGYAVEIRPFPAGAPEGDRSGRLDDRPIARLVFRKTAAAKPDPLFAAVPNRRSTKAPYDTARPVAAADLAALATAAQPFAPAATESRAAAVKALRELTWQAHLVEVNTPRTLMESVRLMRIGKAEIEANPDGIDLGGFFLESLKLLGLLDRKALADKSSSAFKQGLEMYDGILHSAMAYVWITTPDNSRLSQLAAGRAWLRINLTATARGVGVHPVSQALQEYDEMKEHYAKVHRMLGATGTQRIQMFARVGYAARPDPSPRWPLATRLRKA